jgi:hypothetical protein
MNSFEPDWDKYDLNFDDKGQASLVTDHPFAVHKQSAHPRGKPTIKQTKLGPSKYGKEEYEGPAGSKEFFYNMLWS